MVYKFKNSFSEKKVRLIENIRTKPLTCFKHQINIIVAIFVLWKFVPSNFFGENGVLEILIQLEVYFK